MPSSSSTNPRHLRRLQAALNHAFEERTSSIDDTSAPSLLIVDLDSDVVGFTVVDGEAREAFDASYGAFRELYNKRSSAWAQRNLSFVVCRAKSNEEDDEFFNQQQYDVYFCKKYVLQFPDNDEALKQELAHLPFMPLPDSNAGGMRRPVSAQTLLQNYGLSAALARGIVVSGEAGVDTVISRAANQTFVEPSKSRGAIVPPTHQPPSTMPSTRVASVMIKDFRAYRHATFDLSTDVTILYGQNGLGKTSLFDAIEFACTGRIGRLCKAHDSHAHFQSIARHLDAPESAGSVELQLHVNNEPVRMVRSVADWGNASWGEVESLVRAKLLQRLTHAQWTDSTPRIGNLV